MLAFAVRRLRAETSVNARSVVLGAGVPGVATIAYLAFGGSPFHLFVIAVAAGVGAVIGVGLAWLTRVNARASCSQCTVC